MNRLQIELGEERRRRERWYQVDEGETISERPRILNWPSEARIATIPVGATVLGVVEDVRPYGMFVGLVASSGPKDHRGNPRLLHGEDSMVRAFCDNSESGIGLTAGSSVAVKILKVDEATHRIYGSALQADTQWSAPPPGKVVANVTDSLTDGLYASTASDPLADLFG